MHSGLDEQTFDVVVVGAGVAGLTAAYTLKKAGLSTVVLERNAYVGGRVHTIRYGNLFSEAGAMVFADTERETLELAREVNAGEFVLLGTHGSDIFVGDRLLNLRRVDGRLGSPRDFVDLLKLAAATTHAPGFPRPSLSLLMAYRRAVRAIEVQSGSIDTPYDPATHLDWDREVFIDFLGSFHPQLHVLIDLQLQVTAGETSERLSTYWGLVTSNWNSDGFQWLKAGSSSFTDAMCRTLGPYVYLDAEVVSIETKGPVVLEVSRNDASMRVRAGAGVIAIPPRAVCELRSDIPYWKLDALRQAPFGSYITVHHLCRCRFWEGAIRSGYLNTAGTVFADLVDTTKYQGGERGILACILAGAEARRLIDIDSECVVAATLADLERIFPGCGHFIENSFVYPWREGIPYFPPNHAETLGRLRASAGRTVFCGDYTEGAGVHDAVLSGLRAATTVLDWI